MRRAQLVEEIRRAARRTAALRATRELIRAHPAEAADILRGILTDEEVERRAKVFVLFTLQILDELPDVRGEFRASFEQEIHSVAEDVDRVEEEEGLGPFDEEE